MNDGNSVPTAKNAERGTDGVPVFSLDELNRCRGQSLGGGELGVAYAIDGFPGLAVKEIAIVAHEGKRTELAERELEAIPRLSHPGVLKYHQVIRDNHSIYIIMNRYHGDLKEFIANHTRNHTLISKELILSIARQLADALTYLHDPTKVDSCGTSLPAIVHRDLKPANVLISEDGNRIVLADLGLCKDALQSRTTSTSTKPYMAPETLLYNSTSPATDIWSLGVIIYELTTLKRPDFLGDKEPRHVFTSEWRPNLNAVEDEFIKSILEKIFILDPKKRPTARELAELFQKPDIPTMELKTSTNVLDERCKSLEAALNSINPRLELLESSLRAKTDEIDSLREALANKSAEIIILENIIAAQAAEIDALRKKLEIKATKIDAPEQQLADTVRHLARMNRFTPIKDSSWTPLMCAAVTGDIETTKQHLSDKDTRNIDGDTALILAAKAGHRDVVELLDPTDWNGVTALMRATDRNNVEAVKALIPFQTKRKADYIKINKLEMYEGTALMVAAVCGNTEVVRLLVEHEGGMRDSEGWTALMHAVACGHADCARLLVSKEAGMQDEDGWTALMHATYNNKLKCAKLLAEKEGGVQNKYGGTALMLAAEKGHANCVKLLLEKEAGMQDKDDQTALMAAAFIGHIDCVRLLLEHEGAMQDKNGWTALMLAALTNNTKCISLLLEKEAGMQDKDSQTALMFAAARGHVECVKLLLEREARLTDIHGWTALVHAARAGHREAAELLMEHEKDVIGWTMLMCAAALGDVEMVSRHLSEKGQKDKESWTALILAAGHERDEVVKLLMKYESGVSSWTSLICAAYLGDISAVRDNLHEKGCKDITGETALMWAAYRGRREVVRILVEEEGGMQRNDGWTALMVATYSNKLDCVRLLAEREKDMKTTRKWYEFPPGTTALDIARRKGYKEIVSILSE